MKCFIHLGFPKTASTYLQQEVFPNIDGMSYLGKPFGAFIKTEEDILKLSNNEYRLKKKDILKNIQTRINKYNFNNIIRKLKEEITMHSKNNFGTKNRNLTMHSYYALFGNC